MEGGLEGDELPHGPEGAPGTMLQEEEEEWVGHEHAGEGW